MSRFKKGDLVIGVNEQSAIRLAEVVATFNKGVFIKVTILEYQGVPQWEGECAQYEACHFIKAGNMSDPITLISGEEVIYDHKLHSQLSSGKYTLKTEVVVVENANVHPLEFDELGVVVDQFVWFNEGEIVNRFKSSLKEAWISLTEKGWVSAYQVKCFDTGIFFMTEAVATLHGRGYSEPDDLWRLIENCTESLPSRANCVERYHSHTNIIDKSDNSVYTIGYEIEKEDKAVMLSLKAKVSRLELGWRKERDSTLCDQKGFEFISPVYDLFDKNDKRKLDFKNPIIAKHINAKYSVTCGGHINLAEKGKSTTELFEEISGYLPLLYAIYEHRIHVTYSMAKKKDKYYTSRDKYAAVFIKPNVLEFRIFPAVKSVKNLDWRTKLIQIMVLNKTNDPMEVVSMMANQKADLFKHLTSIYTHGEILGKIKTVFKYMKEYDNVTPTEEEEALYNNMESTPTSKGDYNLSVTHPLEMKASIPKIKDALRVVPKPSNDSLITRVVPVVVGEGINTCIQEVYLSDTTC